MTKIAHPLLYGMNITQGAGAGEATRRLAAKDSLVLAAANAGRDVAIRAARMTVGDKRLLGVVLGQHLPRDVEVVGFGQRQVALVDVEFPGEVDKYLVEKAGRETHQSDLREQCDWLRCHFGTVALGAQVVSNGTNVLGRSKHIVTRQKHVPAGSQPLEEVTGIDWREPSLQADLVSLQEGLAAADYEDAAVVGIMNPKDLVVYGDPIETADDDPTARELHIGLISSRLPNKDDLVGLQESWAPHNDLEVYEQRFDQVMGLVDNRIQG